MKLFDDTLKTHDKYSAKRITAFASFCVSCILPIWSFYKGGLTSEVVMLSGEFLAACLVCLGISSWQKTKIKYAEEV